MPYLFLLATLVLTTSSYAKEIKAAAPPAGIEIKSLPGELLQGTKIKNISELKNKVVLVDFWASWCEPCKEALPIYNTLYKKYKDKGLMVLGINADNDPKERDAFLKAHPSDFPMFQDTESKWVRDFKVQALPTLFIFDKNLKAVAMYRGFSPDKAAALEKQINELLSSKP